MTPLLRPSRKAAAVLITAALVVSAGLSLAGAARAASFLWEVKSDQGRVFLMGSIHVARKDLYPLKPAIERAYEQSDDLVVEVDMSDLDPREAQSVLLRRGKYGDGITLDARISAETFEETAERLKRAGLSVEPLLPFKPWFVAMTLGSAEVNRLGFDPEYGIDLHFMQKAKGTKPILALESFEEQIGFLDGFSREDQEAFLLYTMEDLDHLSEEMDRLVSAWLNGDAASIEAVLEADLLDRPALKRVYDRLVVERNRKMLAAIEEYLKTGRTYFVVVGAGHLVGAEGLVRALKEGGYAVRQL